MIDPTMLAGLASSAVAILSPMLKKAAGKALEKMGDGAGAALFEGLKKRFEHGHPSGKEALDELVKNPTDEDAQAALRLHLRKAMEADPAFATELKEWVRKAGAGPTTNSQKAHATHGSTVIQIQGSGNKVG